MQLEVGKIYEGKVTGITKFGAFVELEPGTTGMVHISEIANTFVNEIREHISEGQMVKVKVLTVGNDGKISLSVKKAVEQPAGGERRPFNNNGPRPGGPPRNSGAPRPSGGAPRSAGGPPRSGGAPGNRNSSAAPKPPIGKSGRADPNLMDPMFFMAPAKPTSSSEQGFEDMLSKFKQKSEEKQGDLRRAIDGKRRSGPRRPR